MSVTVSSITSSTTSTNTADWGGHSHSISNSCYVVPDMSEFKNLTAYVYDIEKSLKQKTEENKSLLNGKFSEFTNTIKAITSKERLLNETKYNDFKKEAIAQLSAGGPFFTAFEKMTTSHLKNVQTILDRIQKISKENNGKFDAFHTDAESINGAIKKCYEDMSKSVETMKKEKDQIVAVSKQLANQTETAQKITEKSNKAAHDFYQQHTTLKGELQRLDNDIAERRRQLAILNEQHKQMLSDFTEMMEASAVFNSARGSFVRRMKWLFTGKITPFQAEG